MFKKLLPKKEYFSQALYTFDIGQNDITAGYKLNFTTQQVKGYIPDVLAQFSNVIKVTHLALSFDILDCWVRSSRVSSLLIFSFVCVLGFDIC